jgi:uncharacterized membrane protein
MRIRLESAKRIGRKIGLNEDKGYAVAIFLALIIVSATVIGYYVVLRPQAEPYNTIYLLDANKKAVDYPETLVANQNSTFNVYVTIENHMATSASYFVQVKIVNNLPATFPVDAQPSQVIDMGTINNDGKPVQQTATVTQNTPGSYSVVFELYRNNGDGALVFTQNYCVLNIQVTN